MIQTNIIIFILTFILFAGCKEEKHINYDAKKLIKEKCQSCHNLDMPPKTYPEEVAPPMMAVAFHIYDFVKAPNPSERKGKSISFVCDYVMNPSREKSFCDKQSLDSYGVMPSQKGNLTDGELKAIANYIFTHYTKDNFLEVMQNIQKMAKMPKGEQLAIKNSCLSCHGKTTKKVGPSFHDIYKRNKNNINNIANSIKNGSKGKYKEAKNIPMPKFNNLTKHDIEILTKWISKL